MRIALLAAMIAAMIPLAPTAGFAQTPGGVDLGAAAQESAAAARQSLSTLATLAQGASGARLGFPSPGDAEKSELGTPWSDFIVQLDDLQSWQSGADPMRLLRSSGLIVYPVTVGGAVRSSITLKKQDGGWQAVGFGAPALSQSVSGARAGVADRARTAGSQTFQVRIPAFNLVFVGYVANGTLMLTPAVDTPRFGLSAGAPVAASELFTRLKPDAQKDQGLPR